MKPVTLRQFLADLFIVIIISSLATLLVIMWHEKRQAEELCEVPYVESVKEEICRNAGWVEASEMGEDIVVEKVEQAYKDCMNNVEKP